MTRERKREREREAAGARWVMKYGQYGQPLRGRRLRQDAFARQRLDARDDPLWYRVRERESARRIYTLASFTRIVCTRVCSELVSFMRLWDAVQRPIRVQW